MKKSTLLALALLALPALATLSPVAPSFAAAPAADPQVTRGAYLVKIMACNDCHTPWKMGPKGPAPDMTRELSGHPEGFVMPPPPAQGAGPWIAQIGATNTAWAGPWGVSFTANLTPDPETGLGKWTEANFIQAIRTGRHQGQGRPILPPMPWEQYRNASDDDLKAVFAYLRQVPAIRNRVPQPVDPPEAQASAGQH